MSSLSLIFSNLVMSRLVLFFLMAVPLFMLADALLGGGDISRRVVPRGAMVVVNLSSGEAVMICLHRRRVD